MNNYVGEKCHSRMSLSGNLGFKCWIPAFVGMTTFFILASLSWAAVADDGLSSSLQQIKSHNFEIFYDPSLSETYLISQLNISSTAKFLAQQSKEDQALFNKRLPATVDVLFQWVKGALDMEVSNFSGTIKIVSTHEALIKAYRSLFSGTELPDTGYSFYIPSINTRHNWQILH